MGGQGEKFAELVAFTKRAADSQEDVYFPRQRARKDAIEDRRLAVLEIITANLAHAVLIPPETGHTSVLTGNTGKRIPRYTSPATGKALRDLLFLLSEAGLAKHVISYQRANASHITPTDTFKAAVLAAGLTTADFTRHVHEEVIRLSNRPHDPLKPHGGHKVRVDYPESETSMTMRAQMCALNAFLAGADITFVDDGKGPVNVHNRVLRRHFVLTKPSDAPRLNRGGRLYGGFWQNLERERRAGIRIEGEPVTVLDFASMHPRLVYAGQGVSAGDGDLYVIPGLEEHREAVKLLVNTLLNDHYNRTAWPDDAKVAQPLGWTVKQMRHAIWAHRHHLRNAFGRRLGLDLQFTESRILAEALERLRVRGIVALGLHDGLLVATSHAEETQDVMETTALDIAGQRLPVTVKAIEPAQATPSLSLLGQLSVSSPLAA
ncbi:hypothetical protein [Methylobacterium sp. Leaf88]|uniref:hypothetical protein n=1 Tax=Methylobacterium sp. Leaf88 TaxID=1736244 RepID=UPI0006F86D53|nr:hypothetical protein [Methylobacterium sp. Leaf88]KQO70354.1 hypothetical protein ASF20_05180 [Methylobacterium sp. Leaf88]